MICYTRCSFQVHDDKFLLMSCLLFLQGKIPAKFYVPNIILMLVKEEAMAAFFMLSPFFFFSFFIGMLLLKKRFIE